MSKEANYGAVVRGQEGAEEEREEYDIDNTYYVKEREMSTKEKCYKFLLVLVPILAAVVLVGGFAYYVISHVLEQGGGGGRAHSDVSYPVPSSSSSHGTASRPGTYPAPDKQGPAPTHAPPEKKQSSSESSACAANIKCADLGLVGDCCPTKQGVNLGCCG